VDNTQTAISFNDVNFTFTLTDNGAGWRYMRAGLEYRISGNKTVVLSGDNPPAAGIYYIGIDATDGTLSASLTPFTFADTRLSVAIVLWNNANTPKYILSDERHTCLIDRRVHRYEHFSEGTRYLSGGLLSGYNTTPAVPVDADNDFAITEASIADEDLFHTLGQLLESSSSSSSSSSSASVSTSFSSSSFSSSSSSSNSNSNSSSSSSNSAGTYGNTGGTITTDGAYKVHTFLVADSGTNFTPCYAGNVAALVVGGGGGGGGNAGGGGGGGGVEYNATLAVTATNYNVIVGGGGDGATGGNNGVTGVGSSFHTMSTYGGGGGGGINHDGLNGGSGGGGGAGYPSSGGHKGLNGTPLTAGEGSNGGDGTGPTDTINDLGGGGGGGQSAVGADATTSAGGNGGQGYTSTISGASKVYGSGGGGGMYPSGAGTGGTNAGNGAPNIDNTRAGSGTAGYGGGGGGSTGSAVQAGNGGSGCVIIRCLTTDYLV